ncbi:haloacid dehalogenase [Frondihabitans sucicola]|uniref:Haloacid dehalogenase n=1 Tax=Frondihabitans sucicola TaxID=1268041 RepID=A0ABN6XTW9_9MICO|nr:HAD family phosphatase [Frondihabitans sucicola]BDZ48464.1 haloacid dehalogenase [Frondihabitans sucicola]
MTTSPPAARPLFDAILFDCDGVLVDSEPITNGVLRDMLIELGWQISARECVDRFIGKAIKDELGVIASHTGVTVGDEWIAEFRERRNVALADRLVAVDGAPDVVREIAGVYGDRIAVASGADLHKVHLQLEKVGLIEFFEGRTFSGMDTARSKPAPDVYLLAASSLGVAPDRCVVVEDTPTGVRAGVAAGATVVGYAAGLDAKAAETLTAAGAATVIGDLRDLPEFAIEPAVPVAPRETA